ncbi:hypothetical protein E1211_25850 [Micromonospora sp. 15K316]|uniref:hypothetical protein n=1 Tax=Micromonospora sp. 15K316 TaxID=2530376 RepID=UPI00104A07FF|nr:hypothetical protein [Micromonospora sp. 15K316]TDC29541.1 hypothetical protein E1211_25850 [Micromonospora sp. 15K316]
MRARRLIAAASVAALAVLSLAACGRSAPDAAAYVGDITYQLDRVDAIQDEGQAKFAESVRAAIQQQNGPSASPEPEQLRWNVDQQDVLNVLVGLELATRLTAEKQIAVRDQISAEQLGQDLGVPGTEYAKLAADWYNHYLALQDSMPPAELTDEERSEVYDNLVEAGVAPPGWSVEDQRTQFAQPDIARQVAAVVALSKEFQEAVDREDVTLNPRYSSLAIPALLQVPGAGTRQYDLPYLDRAGTVTDISTPEPLPSSEPADPAGATEPVRN